jgi:hypothetical protein
MRRHTQATQPVEIRVRRHIELVQKELLDLRPPVNTGWKADRMHHGECRGSPGRS